jgi:excisionase family DNA binding protein
MQENLTNPFQQIDQRFDELEALIQGLQKTENASSPEIDPHERLTRADIKKLYKVSFGTIHNAMNSGKLSYDKVGRKTLFKRSDVESWINRK